MSIAATAVDALLAKLNRYAGTASTDLSDTELAYLREQLTRKKKYGLIWEDKPEAVEQQLADNLPVLTEVPERQVINVPVSNERSTPAVATPAAETIPGTTTPGGQIPLAFHSVKPGSLVD